MNYFAQLKGDIPKPIRVFIGKAILVFVVWKLVYGMFFFNSKILDYPLTSHVSKASVFFLNNMTSLDGFSRKRISSSHQFNGKDINKESSLISHNGKQVLYIADACNGLELMVLYIGFIICMPSKIYRKLMYVFIGVIILDIANILRCVGLIYLREYYEVYFQFAHHYVFKIVVYAVTFAIWVFYARKIKLKNEIIPV